MEYAAESYYWRNIDFIVPIKQKRMPVLPGILFCFREAVSAVYA
jgi:hypothetical protein